MENPQQPSTRQVDKKSITINHSAMNRLLILALLISLSSSITKFKFKRGWRADYGITSKNKFPSVYQCAEFCTQFSSCDTISYNHVTKICYTILGYLSDYYMVPDADYILADLRNIPEEMKRHPGVQCNQGDIVVIPIDERKSFCHKYKQCFDLYFQTNCPSTVCDSSNTEHRCNRTCKTCPDD